MRLFEELKRRNVIRVGIAYVLMGWLLLQIADFTLDLVDAPNWVIQSLSIVFALGLPIALFFAWAFEITPEGVKREHEVDRCRSITPQTGRKLDRLIILVLVLVIGLLLADRFMLNTGAPSVPDAVVKQSAEAEDFSPREQPPQTPVVNPKSVAVLPFVAMSSGPDDEYFADGLTEEILNSLAQLPELLVSSRTSAFSFKGRDLSINDVAAQLGVANVVEGSVRRSVERIRVTAQLIRAEDGFHLWSKTYDSTSEDVIAVQEDIAEKIAEALDVVLDDQNRAQMQAAGLRDVEAFVALQKGLEHFAIFHAQEGELLHELRLANDQFEIVQELAPHHARAWVLHADLYTHILINLASGETVDPVFQAEIEQAREKVVYNYQMASRTATTEAMKASLQWDQGYLSGDWRGTARRNELVNRHSGCDVPQWGDMLSIAFGYAEGFLKRRIERAECDPLASRSWIDVAATYMWMGDGDSALAVMENIPETDRNDHFRSIQMLSLLVNGEAEAAQDLVDSMISNEDMLNFLRSYLASHDGDKEEALRNLEQYELVSEWGHFRRVVLLAVMGDREGANRAAAEMDSRPYGYLALPMVIHYCACGAPWDIEVTPNFKAMFEESGLEWPPISPLSFPLKD